MLNDAHCINKVLMKAAKGKKVLSNIYPESHPKSHFNKKLVESVIPRFPNIISFC